MRKYRKVLYFCCCIVLTVPSKGPAFIATYMPAQRNGEGEGAGIAQFFVRVSVFSMVLTVVNTSLHITL